VPERGHYALSPHTQNRPSGGLIKMEEDWLFEVTFLEGIYALTAIYIDESRWNK